MLDNVEDVYALSPMQEGMLFHSIASPGSGVFVNQISMVADGAVDVPILQQVWDELVSRHTLLRTAFVWDGVDEPLQVVRSSVEVPWQIADWRDADTATQDRRHEELLTADRVQAFDLASAPLMRMHLVRLAAHQWRLVWSFHHLILDGWSARLLLRAMQEGYARATEAGTAPPADHAAAGHVPVFRYRDFIAWQAARDEEAAEAFWRRELADVTHATGVGLFGPERPEPVASRPSHAANAPGTEAGPSPRQHRRALSIEATDSLRAFARAQRVTLSTVVQGAWSVLLSRYARERSVVFGVTHTVRPPELPRIEEAVGLFINTVPLRIEVDPDATLGPWLQACQQDQRRLAPWISSPLASIQRWSGLPAGSALFESILVFESSVPGELPDDVAPLRLRDLSFFEQSNYPLAILVLPAERLELLLIYDRDRLDARTVARIAQQLEILLAGFAHQPGARLDALPLTTEAERRRLIVDWNATSEGAGATGQPSNVRDALTSGFVHEAITAAMAARPDDLAVACGDRTLTQGALAAASACLAGRLSACGVGPGKLVGLFADRSVELVVGILGILRAGGAYVPLDASYPAEHLESVLVDARIDVVVAAGPGLAERLEARGEPQERRPIHVITLGLETGATCDAEADATLPVALTAEDPAYVIYTSGSSGRPKGVVVRHRNLMHSTAARFAVYDAPVERFLLLSSFAFDSSVAGIFWTLCQGGALVLPRPGEEQDLAALEALVARYTVTHTLCLPALYRLLVDEGTVDRLHSLRTVIVAGEACPASLGAAHRAALPETRLYNEYGPTEATVWCTVHEITEADGGRPVPIGRPIPGAQIYVLDATRQPVPVGMVGELYVAGEGVAQGYLDQPELDARHFVNLDLAVCLESGSGEEVPDPDRRHIRAYRTGDLARYRPDGCIDFLGRADAQVKIRGHRIEIEGVEAVLREHEDVAEAAVAVIDGDAVAGAGPRARLVAYVVPAESPAAELPATESAAERVRLEGLRADLTARLPAFMVPHTIVPIDTLPRRPNGKVDYRALASSPQVMAESVPETAPREPAPHDPIEQAFERIWATVLGRDRVGVTQNFFAAGGDSILSIQLVSRLRQAGFSAVEPWHIAAHPTIAELAMVVREASAGQVEAVPDGDGEASTPVLDGTDGRIPLSPIQRWFLSRDLVAAHHWNLSHRLELAPDFDVDAFRQALAWCVERHDMLRARFVRDTAAPSSGDGQGSSQGAWYQEVVAFDQALIEEGQVFSRVEVPAGDNAVGQRACEQAWARAQASFDLETGVLLRVLHVPATEGASRGAPDEEPGQLLLTAHHLVVDPISWSIILDDLEAAYQAARIEGSGGPLPLPPTAPYSAWSAAQQARVHGPQAADDRADLDYWLAPFDRYAQALPVDGSPDDAIEANARVIEVVFDAGRTRALTNEALDAYGSRVDELLITALALAFQPWRGHGVLRLGLEAHGRDLSRQALDVSRTVGWFTAAYPVCLELPSPPAAPDEAIKRIKEQLRSVPGDGSSYGALRYLAHEAEDEPLRRLSARPEPLVLFNDLGQVQASAAAASRDSARPWAWRPGADATARAPGNARSHLLEINAAVRDAVLRVDWIYCEGVHEQVTIEQVADRFREQVHGLIDHCLDDNAGSFTASYFPDAGLGGEDLDRLFGQLGDPEDEAAD